MGQQMSKEVNEMGTFPQSITHLGVGVLEECVQGGQHVVRHILLGEAPRHGDQHTRHGGW
jgi:hypothetical protein